MSKYHFNSNILVLESGPGAHIIFYKLKTHLCLVQISVVFKTTLTETKT